MVVCCGQTSVMSPAAFKLQLRQTESLTASVLMLISLTLEVPRPEAVAALWSEAASAQAGWATPWRNLASARLGAKSNLVATAFESRIPFSG